MQAVLSPALPQVLFNLHSCILICRIPDYSLYHCPGVSYQCPICLEDFSSPRHVPGCLHSFCLRCLQGHCRDKRPGDWARCPLCRGNFIIPRNGLDGLTLNFVLQDLIDAKHASAVTAGTATYGGSRVFQRPFLYLSFSCCIFQLPMSCSQSNQNLLLRVPSLAPVIQLQ